MTTRIIFLSLFLLSITIFLMHFLVVGKAIYGDGRYYFSYLPAFLVQHTTNLSSAFVHTNIPSWSFTPKGLPANIYPIGPAVFWSIPYLFLFGLSSLFGSPNPYAIWLQIPLGIYVICLNIIGLWILFCSLRKFFSSHISLLTTVTIFSTTNLLFYGAVDVLNSHAITFFLSSLFIYFWLRKTTVNSTIINGVLLGLLILVRPQEAVFALLLLPKIFIFREKLPIFSFVIAGLIFLPQLIVWQLLWGSWVVNPYLHAATFNFLTPHILEVLFNKQSGLFLWTPITLIASIGLFLFARKNKTIGIPILCVVVSELVIISSWSIWWEGASYSARMFVSSLPFFAFGLGYLFENSFVKKIKYILFAVLAILNVYLIILFLLQK